MIEEQIQFEFDMFPNLVFHWYVAGTEKRGQYIDPTFAQLKELFAKYKVDPLMQYSPSDIKMLGQYIMEVEE